MRLRPSPREAGRTLLEFLRGRKGVAAVEFALILPLMLLLYVGGAEVTTLLTIDRKVSRAASTLTDLLSQDAVTLIAGDSSTYDAQAANIMDASRAIIEPFKTSNAKILLLVVNVGTTPQTVVKVNKLNDTTAASVGSASPIAVPATIATTGNVVVGRVVYSYSSPFSSAITGITSGGSYTFSHVYYVKPRGG